jgi:hypothetical protein
MEGKVSDSAFILYLSQLIADMCYQGTMPEDDDLIFIHKQFDERGWQDYHTRIFEDF